MIKYIILTVLLFCSTVSFCQVQKEYEIKSIEVYKPVKDGYEIDYVFTKPSTLVLSTNRLTIYDKDNIRIFGYSVEEVLKKGDNYKICYRLSTNSSFYITKNNEFILIDHKLYVYKFNLK